MHPAIAKNAVGVVTGAAYGGLGFAMASRLLSQGLKVVLADIDQANLDRASQVLLQNGVPQSSFLAFNTDVTNQDSCKQLADRAFEFGGGSVDVLHLNAGVADRSKAKAWENASDSFDKVFQVNFGGVLHGARAFVGRMIENRTKPGLVIVTGSKQGITMPPATGAAYNTSKAMVKAYTEMLDYELRTLPSSQMRAALMVPGWVFTKLTSGGKSAEPNAEKPAGAWTPEQTVDYTLDKLDKGSFYIICPDNETSEEVDKKRMQWSASDVVEGRPPLSRWHPDFKEQFEAHMAA